MADPAPGYTTGQVKDAIEAAWASSLDIKTTLVDWIGEAYQIEAASGTGSIAFALGLVMVFLILAAQYARWLLPLAVASAVPFGALGAVIFCLLQGVPNDIYFQVGILVLIGLSSKNAILIVEFAAQNKYGGMTASQAASAAARQRFRAIMMTALTFIIGALPLLFASGAGANSRRELGTVVVGGMILASSLALVFVPLSFRLVEDFADWLKKIRGKGKPDD
jgi:HAE1 family hydrophobic/amphiphilic exporter-1/multidrug efflux pump